MSLLTAAQLMTNSLRVDEPTFDFPTPVDWKQLVHHADGHSLTPLLYDVWRKAGMLHHIPGDVRARMAQAYADNAHRNTHIRCEVLEIHQTLSDAGVPHLILKGWPLVEQLYTDPAHRVLYDHDFLIPADCAVVGQQALDAEGFKPLPTKDGWVEKHLQPVWRNEDYAWDGYLFDPHYPRPIELHLSLWDQGWRGLQINSLQDPWADTQTKLIAGTSMQLLSPENTLIHLAMHFAGHLIEREARLNQLLDLARFMAFTCGVQSSALDKASKSEHQIQINWEQVFSRSQQANVSRFVYASLYLTHQIFGAPLPPDAIWQQFLETTPPAFNTWLIEHGPSDVLTSDYRRVEKGKDYRLTFLAANSLRERLGIVRFALLPPIEQLIAIYNPRHRWLGLVLYPRYIFDRMRMYRRGVVRMKDEG